MKDITGQRFNRLVVIKSVGKNKWENYIWECLCDCGKKVIVSGGHLTTGQTKSCNCLQKDRVRDKNITHQMSQIKFYGIYRGILTRCNNSNNPRYHCYGGRGIKCLWRNFEEFKDDMYKSYQFHIEKFGERKTSIDRIDNNGNYCKENCRWATSKEQANNRRPRSCGKPDKMIIH